MQDYYLAQINVARMKAPLDDPIMVEFKEALDEVNEVADNSPGFVWRLQNESGDATDIRAYDDPNILVNVSVWQSAPQLQAYVYGSLHKDFFVRRRQWFEKFNGEHFGMWWTLADQFPSATEGRERIEHLTLHGESSKCFTFGKLYPAPQDSSLLIS